MQVRVPRYTALTSNLKLTDLDSKSTYEILSFDENEIKVCAAKYVAHGSRYHALAECLVLFRLCLSSASTGLRRRTFGSWDSCICMVNDSNGVIKRNSWMKRRL